MPDLLKDASLLLAREAARLPVYPSSASRSGTIIAAGPPQSASNSGAAASEATYEAERTTLQQQLSGVIDTLLSLVPQVASASRESTGTFTRGPLGVAGVGRAVVPRLAASGRDASGQVPSLRCVAPVAAGATAHFALRVANHGKVAYPAALCSTALIAGTGFEIPSVHVVASPRVLELPPHAEAVFEVAVHVPQQSAPGTYAGLLRALGLCDFQAVLVLEVS